MLKSMINPVLSVKIKIIFLFTLLFIVNTTLIAQTAPDTLWTKHFPGKCGNSIIQTDNGDFVVVGHINGGHFSGDIYIIKTDSLGQIIWENTISSDNLEDSANSIKKANNDSFIITGNYNDKPFLTKINSNGDSIWFRRYTDYEFQTSNSVDIDEDGNIAFCGYNVFSYIVKTDSLGNQIWVEYFPSDPSLENSFCNHIQFLPDNELAIAGSALYYCHPGHEWSESYLIKTDNWGTELFYIDFEWSNSPKFIYTNDYEFIFISDDKIYKVDSDGNDIWEMGISFHSTSIISKENNFLIAGYYEGNPCVLKIDENGNQIWLATYYTNTNDYIYDIINTNDDGFALTGRSDNHMYIIKLGSEGISSTDDLIIDNNYLYKNFPNPFNSKTIISYSIPQETNVILKIYNIKGQKVKQLLSNSASQLSAGQHSVTWDGTDDNKKPVSSGIYFYKLRAGDFQKVKKMVMLR